MKIAIIYSSRTGFSKQYAEMLQQKVGGELFDLSKMRKLNQVMGADVLVYIASIMGGRMREFKFIDKNIYDLERPRKIFVGVGLTPPEEQVYLGFKQTNCPFGFENKIKFFLLRGGMRYSELRGVDKLLMKNILKNLSKKEERSPVEEEMYQAIINGADYVNEESLEPIVQEILHPTPFEEVKVEEPKIAEEEKGEDQDA